MDSVNALRAINQSLHDDVPLMRGFFLMYQPQFNRYGYQIGVEALLRWEPACGNQVGPDTFIALLEQNELLRQVGKWVIREALRGLRQIRETNHGVRHVSVNVSAMQLTHEFADFVHSTVDNLGMAPDDLVLELTESQVVKVQGYDVIQKLADMGYRWEIDDFGAGETSIRSLRRRSFTGLKLDKSMLDLVHKDPPGLLGAIVHLAKTLGMTVTSEGVETVSQFEWLKELGVDCFQGFHFGKPTRLT